MTTAVMVHGAFCGGWAFEHFRQPFEAGGWRVIAPDLRGHEDDAAPQMVAGLSMEDYVRDLERLCADLPEPPVLIGHSMGGLVCQMAARRIRPSAMVLLAPSPPWGVTGASVEEAVAAAAVGLMDPFWSGAVAPDREVMRRHSLDRVAQPYRDAVLARVRPESARALREVLNWWLDPFMTTSVGAGPLPVPTLAIAGGHDQIHPAATVRRTAERIGAACREAPQMSHWLIGEPEWAEVAAMALDWLDAERRAAA